MTTAHLGGWNVRTIPLTATEITDDGVTTLPITDHYATIRTHPLTGKPDVLGVVGANYTVVQNEQHCELLNLLVDEAGAHFETAGCLRGGRETFVTMKLPQHPHPRRHRRPPTTSSCTWPPCPRHDGTTAWRVIVTPVRIVCANTQRIALRHRPGVLLDPAHPLRRREDRRSPPRPRASCCRYCEPSKPPPRP